MREVIYNILTLFALPFLLVMGATNRKMRKNFRRRLFPEAQDTGATGACMVHGASIGEAVIAANLAGYLADNNGPGRFLFTTNTSYAKEMLQKKLATGDASVTSLPFDLLFSVKRFLRHRKPSSLIIVETEIWPNLIWQARKMGIPVIIINGRISDGTLKNYRRISFFMKKVLSSIDVIIAQSEEHRERFISIGAPPEHVVATGNIKYFRPAARGPAIAPSHGAAVTFGSVKEKELDEVYRAAAMIINDLPVKTVYIAPREIHLSDTIERDMAQRFSTVRFSKLKDGQQTGADIVVVDTVGDLMEIYGKSAVAFVGGSLAPYGGQNMLEPLFVGTPALFGPHTGNFRDIAAAILERNAGFLVNDGEEIYKAVKKLLGDETFYGETVRAGREIVSRQEHIMEETVRVIMGVLKR